MYARKQPLLLCVLCELCVLCAQDRANLIYEQKMAAEKRGEVDLAAKLERDFKVGLFRRFTIFRNKHILFPENLSFTIL